MKAIKSTIKSVTVFTDRAQVVRTAIEDVEAGEHTMVFENLPAEIEKNSIQVNGKGNAIIKDVKFSKKYYAEVQDEAIKSLELEKNEIVASINKVNDDTEIAKSELSFIEDIAKKLTATTSEATPDQLDPDKWIKMVEFYRDKRNKLVAEIRDTKVKSVVHQEELKIIKNKIRDLGVSKQEKQFAVEVVVSVKQAGNIALNLTYLVFGPQWYPLYDLRVSTEEKKMNITYYAVIQQSTSENWDDVELYLSTAQARLSGQQPELSPWRIDIYQSQHAKKEKKWQIPSPQKLMSKTSSDDEVGEAEIDFDEFDVEEMNALEVEVETNATSVVFAVNGKNTILSDNNNHKVTILVQNFDAKFQYSTVPKLTQFAYLKSNVKNETDFPFLPGSTNVFLDNSFVANSKMKLVAPSEEFETSLGVDEGMKVEYKFLKKYKKEEGVFSKRIKIFYEYQFVIKSNKKNEEIIIIRDQLPISENQEIEVELILPEVKKENKEVKRNDLDYLEWQFKMKPNEEIKIPFKFAVEYPRNMLLSGL